MIGILRACHDAVNGERTDMFEYKYGAGSVTADLRALAGQTVTLTIERDGTRMDVPATLRSQEDVDAGQPALGVTMDGGEWIAGRKKHGGQLSDPCR